MRTGIAMLLAVVGVTCFAAMRSTPVEEFGMRPWQAVVLGVVEGATEFLPVSSTGHLILAERSLGFARDPETRAAADTFTIVIQIGAILAVVSVYHSQLRMMAAGW